MSADCFLRLKKLTDGPGHLLAAARHNKRAIQAEKGADSSIYTEFSACNQSLHGPTTPEEVAMLAKKLVAEAGIKTLRKDAVRAVEVLFCLPTHHKFDDTKYFNDCLRWTESHFGGVILSADIHRDEAAPHCHILILPLINNRMVGSDMMGNKFKLVEHHESFYKNVGMTWGLRKPNSKLRGKAKKAASNSVIQHLRNTSDPVLRSAIWSTLRGQIESDPAPHASALGLTLEESASKPQKKMVQIFTSKGKGGNHQNTYRVSSPS